ncbi:MAG: fibronectin type III domain-containing protein, partial [Planctomycetia bacterium]|nr:fibronectin type III domain-containing protein [Planctomycetia bacterium]
YSRSGYLTVVNSAILENRAGCWGGGICRNEGDSTVTNSMVSGNEANDDGGGIFSGGGLLTVTNCLIDYNESGSDGGGIARFSGDLAVTNSTISKNAANGDGGGIFSHDATTNVYNTIVVENVASEGDDISIYGAHSEVNGYNSLSSYTAWNGENNYVYDSSKPLFADAANGDFRLVEGSQAIDKGDNRYTFGITTDLSGSARIYGETVDLGAFESPEWHEPVEVSVNKTKVTIAWTDETPQTGDTVRYREEGTSRWTVRKLRAGVESLTFTGRAGMNYEIQVLQDGDDEQIVSVYSTILAQPKLKTVGINYDWFVIDVTNFSTTNLATSAQKLVVTLDGEELVVDIHRGGYGLESVDILDSLEVNGIQSSYAEGYFADAGVELWFEDGHIGFWGLASNTTYNVTVAFACGGCLSAESALRVKTAKAPYEAPENVTAKSVSASEILVTWDASVAKDDSTKTAERYTIQYSVDGQNWTTATTNATGGSYTITRLASETTYEIRVFAREDRHFLASELSATVTATTGVLLAQPKLKADLIWENYFEIEITNYETSNLKTYATAVTVTIDKIGSVDVALDGQVSMLGGMEITFDGNSLIFNFAPSSTTYPVTVSFKEGDNASKSSKINVKTIAAQYFPPTNVTAKSISASEIVVTWDASRARLSDRTAEKYTVQYLKNGRWTTATTNATGGSYTITRLASETEYKIRVSATKDRHFLASEASDPVKATTGVLLAQPKLKTYAIRENAFIIEITNYETSNLKTYATAVTVTIDKIGSVNIPTNTNAPEGVGGGMILFSDGLLAVGGLQSSTTYPVTVSFKMEDNASKSSKITVKTTKTPYLAPTNVSATVQSDTEILVTWDASVAKDDSTKTAERYTIQYSVDGQNWTTATTNATGTSYVVKRLKASTEYLIRVSAKNDSRYEGSDPEQISAPICTFLATPTITSVTSRVSSTAVVSWNTVANADKFTLQYRKSSDTNSDWIDIEVANDDKKFVYTLTGLESGETYEFQILAVSATFPSSLPSPIKVLRKVK